MVDHRKEQEGEAWAGKRERMTSAGGYLFSAAVWRPKIKRKL